MGPNWNIAFADSDQWLPPKGSHNHNATRTANDRNNSSTRRHIAAWQGIYRGDVSYEDLPDLYRRAKILVDDANAVTLPWGSLNSRVFDAISAGTLVITNGESGFLDLFGHIHGVEALVYRSNEDLNKKLRVLSGAHVTDPLALSPPSLRSRRGDRREGRENKNSPYYHCRSGMEFYPPFAKRCYKSIPTTTARTSCSGICRKWK